LLKQLPVGKAYSEQALTVMAGGLGFHSLESLIHRILPAAPVAFRSIQSVTEINTRNLREGKELLAHKTDILTHIF
jgi:hypothetical protein